MPHFQSSQEFFQLNSNGMTQTNFMKGTPSHLFPAGLTVTGSPILFSGIGWQVLDGTVNGSCTDGRTTSIGRLR